jgi:hypothetical protein
VPTSTKTTISLHVPYALYARYALLFYFRKEAHEAAEEAIVLANADQQTCSKEPARHSQLPLPPKERQQRRQAVALAVSMHQAGRKGLLQP